MEKEILKTVEELQAKIIEQEKIIKSQSDSIESLEAGINDYKNQAATYQKFWIEDSNRLKEVKKRVDAVTIAVNCLLTDLTQYLTR